MPLFRKEMRRRQASFGTSYAFNGVIIAVALFAAAVMRGLLYAAAPHLLERQIDV